MKMQNDVVTAHRQSMEAFAQKFDADGRSGSAEVAFLLRRAARAAEAMVKGVDFVVDEMPKPDPPREDVAGES